MSEINYNRKIFLEKEELSRMQEFFQDSTVSNLIQNTTSSFGIVEDRFDGNDENFKVGIGTNAGTVQLTKDVSKAVDKDFSLIKQEAIDNLPIPNDSNWYWLRISHRFRRHELGTVQVNAAGEVTGSGTLFTDVLRGQSTDVPTKIRFFKNDPVNFNEFIPSDLNSGVYEISNVIDDTNVRLAPTEVFTPESNLYYLVVGSTPIGSLIETAQREGLYKYSGTYIERVAETVEDTPPTLAPEQEDYVFYIARVRNVGGAILQSNLQDKRTQFWRFNTPGLDGKLEKSENLNDLFDKSTARDNLDVYSTSQVDESVNNLSEAFNEALGTRLAKSSNLNDLANKAAARTNLDVYSKGEVVDKINERGVLVYSARIYETSAQINTSNLTVFVNKDNFIASVDAASNRYQFHFTNQDSGWLDKYEVQAASGGNDAGTIGANRNPHILDYNNGNGAEVYLADTSGNDQYGKFWIRIYKWA